MHLACIAQSTTADLRGACWAVDNSERPPAAPQLQRALCVGRDVTRNDAWWGIKLLEWCMQLAGELVRGLVAGQGSLAHTDVWQQCIMRPCMQDKLYHR